MFPELDNRQMKVVRLSAPRTGRLYLQEIFLVLISVRGHSAAGKIKSMENLNDPPPSGIEPATLRLVAQCFDQLQHRVTNIQSYR